MHTKEILHSELANNLNELDFNILLEILAEYLIGWFVAH
jgi:hypothetical protein